MEPNILPKVPMSTNLVDDIQRKKRILRSVNFLPSSYQELANFRTEKIEVNNTRQNVSSHNTAVHFTEMTHHSLRLGTKKRQRKF